MLIYQPQSSELQVQKYFLFLLMSFKVILVLQSEVSGQQQLMVFCFKFHQLVATSLFLMELNRVVVASLFLMGRHRVVVASLFLMGRHLGVVASLFLQEWHQVVVDSLSQLELAQLFSVELLQLPLLQFVKVRARLALYVKAQVLQLISRAVTEELRALSL